MEDDMHQSAVLARSFSAVKSATEEEKQEQETEKRRLKQLPESSFIEHQRRLLLQAIVVLQERLPKKKGAGFELRPDPLDQTQYTQEIYDEAWSAERLNDAISACKTSLSQIKASDYLICIDVSGKGCNETISRDRLIVNPMAQLCARCQTAKEKGRRY